MSTRCNILVSPDQNAEGVYQVELQPQQTDSKSYSYQVQVDQQFIEQAPGYTVNAETVLIETFRFLLEHEPPEAILKEFALADVTHYYPDFPNVLLERLAAKKG